jgi:Flp pilus assembly protein CpaB
LNRRFLATAVAAALAVLGVVLVLAYVRNAEHNVAYGKHPVFVLAADQPIPLGTRFSTALNTGMLHAVPYPRAALPSGYITKGGYTHQEYVEYFTSALQSEQVIVAKDIGPKSQAASPLVPPPGNYAVMSLPVCESAAVAGWIGPGVRIAVFNTAGSHQAIQTSCSSHQSSADGTQTSIVAEGLEVLSVTGAPAPASSAGTPVSDGGAESGCSADGQGQMCVTVAVPSAQALEVADAAATGDLTVVLMTDQTVLPPTGHTYTSKP